MRLPARFLLLPLLAAACTHAGPATPISAPATPVAATAPSRASAELAATKTSRFIGTLAPAFTLTDSDNKKVSLADHKGHWVVLYFFPRLDTPGCACMATAYTTLLDDLVDLPADVLTVSDNSPEDADYYRGKFAIDAPMLSDTEAKVTPLYGVQPTIHDDITRATFIINPEGRIVYHWPDVEAEGHVKRIVAKLKELRGE